jgi:hypothetical protein
VGGLLLGLTAFGSSLMSSVPELVTKRLVLHPVHEPTAIYLSAWRNGDVSVQFEDGDLVPITFRVRGTIPDGCRWEGKETLVPIDHKTFTYEYSEEILNCPPGTESTYRKTPRTGLVTAE